MDKKVGSNHCAVLLAAGYGSRISGLTDRPKSLLEINGRTLLDHHFDTWRAVGIKNVNLVLGYKASEITDAAKKYESDFSIKYLLNEDYRNYGNTFSLLLGISNTEELSSLIFDADLIYEKSMLENILKDTVENQILIGPGNISDIECAKALVDKNDYVRMTVDKRAISEDELSRYEFRGEAIGILKFNRDTTKALKNACESFLKKTENLNKNWEHVLNEFLPGHDIATHFNDSGKWIEIDTPEDYKMAQEKFER